MPKFRLLTAAALLLFVANFVFHGRSAPRQVDAPGGAAGRSLVADGEPDVAAFAERVRLALRRFQERRQRQLAFARCNHTYGSRTDGFLPGCPAAGCVAWPSLEAAKAVCSQWSDCGGVTASREGGWFEPRARRVPLPSPAGEVSWVRTTNDEQCYGGLRGPWTQPPSQPNEAALAVSRAYTAVVDAALAETPALTRPRRPPREDGTIFVSIGAHRDPLCGATVRRAFARAARPERLSFGIVQHNCERACLNVTGGFGATRRYPPQLGADEDCVSAFCASPEGEPHCASGRVRILRLGEEEALGPIYSRFLASHLWRGETFFLQIDGHTDFRAGWDSALVRMARRTPSFPRSVLSNYPPEGSPASAAVWPRPTDAEERVERPAGGLCSYSYETVLPAGRLSARLGGCHAAAAGRAKPSPDGAGAASPRRTAFVAAGFLFSHASFLRLAPYDPYLPWIFMGEELAHTFRLWTAGFDIYSPNLDVLRHAYRRENTHKFWENVDRAFATGGIHNALVNLTVQRIQHLLGWPEAAQPSQVAEAWLLHRKDQFGAGAVRSRDAFDAMHGIRHNSTPRRQEPPGWCCS